MLIQQHWKAGDPASKRRAFQTFLELQRPLQPSDHIHHVWFCEHLSCLDYHRVLLDNSTNCLVCSHSPTINFQVKVGCFCIGKKCMSTQTTLLHLAITFHFIKMYVTLALFLNIHCQSHLVAMDISQWACDTHLCSLQIHEIWSAASSWRGQQQSLS